RVPQVRPLPHLPARARPPGRHPRHDEEQLVGGRMLTDPVADMLTRIRNANKAMHETTSMPHSRLKEGIAELLKTEGYIKDYKVDRTGHPVLVIELKYGRNRERIITDIKRV